jgi:hypothetical protein
MKEFIVLRSKIYAYKVDEVEKKCKGVKKCVVKNSITFEDYDKSLFKKEEQCRTMNLIRNHEHEAYSVEINKIA